MKAMVVDDEILTAEHICRLLRNLEVEVSGCDANPLEALGKVGHLKPDVLFLDIEMPEMNGLELAERVHAMGYEGEIVFVTAYNQYAIEAFSVNALDYLLKPVMPERLERAVERVRKRRGTDFARTSGSKAKKIRVSLFGNLSLYIGDQEEPIHWMTAKCAEVFAFMLLQNRRRVVSKWKLIEAVWPDKDKEKADINLRSTLCRLNKTLREYAAGISMVSTGNGYRLDCKDVVMEVDAFKLERLVLDAVEINPENVEHCNGIIWSYSEMLLEECNGEWCNAMREHYHRCFIGAVKKLIKYYEKMNMEPLKTLHSIELLIKYEPYDEDARESALKLHYRLGGRQSAGKYYREYRYLLKKELEIEPGESIQRAYGCLMKT